VCVFLNLFALARRTCLQDQDPLVDSFHRRGGGERARGRFDILAGRQGRKEQNVASTLRMYVMGLAWSLVSTSPHAPRLRPRLLPLVAIRFTILILLSVTADTTVFTAYSISPTVRCSQGPRDLHRRISNHRHCGDVCSRATRAQPPCTSLSVVDRRSGSSSAFTATHCAPSSSLLLMHPPSFAQTKLIPLLQPQHKNSSRAANNCAHFVYHHCNTTTPLHWPRWSASDTCSDPSPDFH
jgi:hypothetical protein